LFAGFRKKQVMGEYIPDPAPVRKAVPFRRAAAIFMISSIIERNEEKCKTRDRRDR
jgi:hypothetical protein